MNELLASLLHDELSGYTALRTDLDRLVREYLVKVLFPGSVSLALGTTALRSWPGVLFRILLTIATIRCIFFISECQLSTVLLRQDLCRMQWLFRSLIVRAGQILSNCVDFDLCA